MINEFNRESVTKEFPDFGFIESKDIEEPVKLMEGQESIKLKLVICKKTKDLNQLSTEELGKLFPIRISEHNPEWKNMFASEKQLIQNAIGAKNIIMIEHIGSTSVIGLCAKPTIDILVEIKDNTNTDQIISELNRIDYQYIPKPENPPPHMMFAKGYSNHGFTGQTFHIHVRYIGDWDELVFRDFLIQNPKIANEYSELKLKLSTDYINDREKYTNNKTEFITRVTKTARKVNRDKFKNGATSTS